MLPYDDGDDIDWAAAVAELENAEAAHLQNKHRSAARASKQQTIDSFFGSRPAPRAEPSSIRESTPNLSLEGVHVPIDPAAATTWVYPANIPRRDYQFSITRTALFSNTLVSLPTGLGKTMIAAVVMYNFYRWFPEGKIVFTAPSRPLVVQQIEACHNVVGIPQDLTIDMTGQMSPAQRAEFWKSRRVFFVTPQVLEKDIHSGTCPVKQLVCLVVDEAHRAVGNYAYCTVVREIMAAKISSRILALTATPGSKQAAIQAVVDNLNISCMEYRDEDDPDVSHYTHNRKIELILVRLNAESTRLRDMFIEVLQPVVSKLSNYGVFYNRDIGRLTPYEFLTSREKFRQAPPAALAQSQYGEVEGCFGAGITLCHIFKLLSSHGIKPALEMLRQKMEQGLLARMMSRNEKLHQIKRLMEQTVSHGASSPKLVKLEEIVVDHFGSHDPGNTRIIIFSNFRESVKDIMEALAKLDGPIKAMEFIGQSSGKNSKGQSQKMQQQVLQKFRTGGFNTIVATCIGEEGLDIMEVDLVICFDANVSPLRMIQRMGRTGRKRDGRVVVLASEGQEHEGYLNKQAKGKAVGKHMQHGGTRSFNFHSSSRMVPHAFKPELLSLELTIEQFVPRGRKNKDEINTGYGAANLTSREKSLLSKYFNSSQEEEPWQPSLIAFPNYQLFPTPIQSVRHSSRTTGMLIDVLQELRGVPLKETAASFVENDQAASPKLNDPTEHEKTEPSKEVDEPEEEKTEIREEVDDLPMFDLEDVSQLQPENNELPEQQTRAVVSDSEEDETLVPEPVLNNFPASGVVSDSEDEEDEAPVQLSEQHQVQDSSHRCFFSTGVVSVTGAGLVVIASPPRFPQSNPVINPVGELNSEFQMQNSSGEAQNNCSFSPDAPTVVPESDEFVLETPEADRQRVSPAGFVQKSPAGFGFGFEAPAGTLTPRNEEENHQRSGAASKGSSEAWKGSQLPSEARKPRPLKRLRRGRELLPSLTSPKNDGEKSRPTAGNLERRRAARVFIDEEADVSSDVHVSADEEGDCERSNNSFIDDATTVSNGAASGSPVDMMAIYRRSLLTQSPAELPHYQPAGSTPASSSAETASIQGSSSRASTLETRQISNAPPEAAQNHSPASVVKSEVRKRKLSFPPASSNGSPSNGAFLLGEELFSDDVFEGLDLDALEAEATLKCRSRASASSSRALESFEEGKKKMLQPSFDLGIFHE